MPYEFQKKRWQKGDWVDPIPLNMDFQTPAGVVNGRIDKDNIQEGAARNTVAQVDLTNQCFVPWLHFGFRVDPQMYTGAAWSFPSGSAGDGWAIPNDGQWSPIPLVAGAGGATSISVTTGTSGLDITAFVQYCWEGFLPASTDQTEHAYNPKGKYGARVQFAVRLNGRVVEASVTGHSEPFHSTPRGEKPLVHRQVTDDGTGKLLNKPGPQIERTTNVGTCGPDMFAQRLGAYVEVAPGRHTIELVARRYGRSNTGVGYVSGADKVYVYTRHGLIQEAPFHPGVATAGADIQIPSLDSEDVIDAGELYTKRAFVLQTRVNNIKEGNLARGALNHDHLPGAIHGATQGDFVPSGHQVLKNRYPGVLDSRSGNAHTDIGWYPLQAGATLFKTSTGLSVTSGQGGGILVRADVQIPILYFVKNGAFSISPWKMTARWDLFGALILGWRKLDGTTGIIPDSAAFFNGWNWSNYATFTGATWPANVAGILSERKDHLNISLLGWIALSGTETVNYDYFQVLGSVVPATTMLGATSHTVYTGMRYYRGTISALHLRP